MPDAVKKATGIERRSAGVIAIGDHFLETFVEHLYSSVILTSDGPIIVPLVL
jgi:hypothetical protein